MTMGGMLKEAREAKHLSLEVVSRSTKLSVTVLMALEAQDFSKLAGDVYARAFVKTYAGFLGIGPQALEEYKKIARSAAPEVAMRAVAKAQTPMPEIAATTEKSKRPYPWWFLAAGGSACALIGFFWYVLANSQSMDMTRIPVERAAQRQEAIAQPVPPPAVQQTKNNGKPSPVLAVQPSATVAREGLFLEIIAQDKVWLRVKADNLMLFEGTLEKDTREIFKAQREFLLRIGSAGAVTLVLNDQELAHIGNKGEVKTVVINKDGIVKTR